MNKITNYLLLIGLLATACTSASAQNTLYGVKDGDRFSTEFTTWDLDNIDSIRFAKNICYLFCKPDENGSVKRLSKTYNSLSYFTFTRPERNIYKPNEVRNMNFDNENSRWCWKRSRESEHFIVFWEKGFGNDPAKSNIKLNVDLLLERAEHLFDVYADELGFIERGNSRSTDRYKIMIMVNYSTDWLATGSGYDNVIGALWCTPWALEAAGGHTVAHEVGHSFQYLVSCDLGTSHGWRWGFGDNGSGGCAWWESCAQWQGFKVYPEQQFNNDYTSDSRKYVYHNLLHEDWRYANYFIQDYWCQLHGRDFIGRLWRASTFPEDPIETYKRMNDVSQEAFNDEFFNYACRTTSWDIDGIRDYGKFSIDCFTTQLNATEDGGWRVDASNCPENYGMNIIRVNNAPAGTTLKAHFKGIAGADGYRKIKTSLAGWRYGFCALGTDGTRTYGEIYSDKEGDAAFTVPANSKMVWFVVTGAPTTHFRHPWDDNADNDEQWPYEVKFENTDKYGFFNDYPADYVRKDTTVTIDCELLYSSQYYSSTEVQLDLGAISEALGISTEQMKKLGSSSSSNPSFCAVNPKTGSFNYSPLTSTSTKEYFGHWFNDSGVICNYDNSARIFSEIYVPTYKVYVGQYPGKLTKGKTYTIIQAVRYKTGGKTYTAKFIINVKIV